VGPSGQQLHARAGGAASWAARSWAAGASGGLLRWVGLHWAAAARM
jgi:hypothetical protein